MTTRDKTFMVETLDRTQKNIMEDCGQRLLIANRQGGNACKDCPYEKEIISVNNKIVKMCLVDIVLLLRKYYQEKE